VFGHSAISPFLGGPQKTSVYPSKSPVYPQKSPVHQRKTPAYLQKSLGRHIQGTHTARSREDETRNGQRNANQNPEWWGDFSQPQIQLKTKIII